MQVPLRLQSRASDVSEAISRRSKSVDSKADSIIRPSVQGLKEEKSQGTVKENEEPGIEEGRNIGDDDKEVEDDDLVDIVTDCGYGRWRPAFLQCMNTPCSLVICLVLFHFVLGLMVNGIINGTVSTIQRRYNLDSFVAGLIQSGFNVSAAAFAVVFGYLDSRRTKTRLLAFSIFSSSIGAFIYALPHFTAGAYTLGGDAFVCDINMGGNTTCQSSSHMIYGVLFVGGNALLGLGGTGVITVGVTLLDNCVEASKVPAYLGMIYGSNILGAGMGFVVASEFLKIYIDFDTMDQVHLTDKDPRWLGAWWIGPLLSSVLLMVICFPVSLFGSELPPFKQIQKTRINQAHITSDTEMTKAESRQLTNVTRSLMRNPCFICVTLAMSTDGMFLSGLAPFMPSFVENQFRVPAYFGTLLTGMAVVPGAAGGLVLGGFIARYFKFTIRQTLKFLMIVTCLGTLSTAVIWVGCEPVKMYGINTHYPGVSSGSVTLDAPCNQNCSCDTNSYEPVCNENTEVYFSPCYAGCLMSNGSLDDPQYVNCSCIGKNNQGMLSKTDCIKQCGILYPFIALVFVAMIVNFMVIAPADSVQLRCVIEEHKIFAQGVKTLVVRMLGSSIGPLLLGIIKDNQCEVSRESCGSILSCWIFNTNDMVFSLFLFCVTLKCMTLLFITLAFKYYKPPVIRGTEMTIGAPEPEKPTPSVPSVPESN